ncbi:hypothetical protein [Nocardia cyriacigeorgica]|uniref:hypothetical protein n=1 Tax=Nocardia cyriacigeorgica TaxID=135487 RepID=UPI002456BB2B|nr:hypothetical protein [Nocardia cyriacigeorgica]
MIYDLVRDGDLIVAIDAREARSGSETRFHGAVFIDCTGTAILGLLVVGGAANLLRLVIGGAGAGLGGTVGTGGVDVDGRGGHRAEEFGKRNGVTGELVVRVRPHKVIAAFDMTG